MNIYLFLYAGNEQENTYLDVAEKNAQKGINDYWNKDPNRNPSTNFKKDGCKVVFVPEITKRK